MPAVRTGAEAEKRLHFPLVIRRWFTRRAIQSYGKAAVMLG